MDGVTASFLAGSILSLVLPVAALLAVGVGWGAVLRRKGG